MDVLLIFFKNLYSIPFFPSVIYQICFLSLKVCTDRIFFFKKKDVASLFLSVYTKKKESYFISTKSQMFFAGFKYVELYLFIEV